jgi:hypothetical protein
MVDTAGGAIKRRESCLTVPDLTNILQGFFAKDGDKLCVMKAAMQRYKGKSKSPELCDVVLEMLK